MARDNDRPDVLMICVDHWPGSFFGACGRKDIETPTLDYLGRNGLMFNSMYSECPVCIPARRSLMTGLSPRSHGDRVYSELMRMPERKTLAQCFRDNGYQAVAVGKLHVFPQRNRIGFDDVILAEEGRYEFDAVDDYQIWLGEHGQLGKEFSHGIGSNTYYTTTWNLPEEAHPTSWVTREMTKQIRRRDPEKNHFFYASFQAPHPPIVPLERMLRRYDNTELEPLIQDNWEVDDTIRLLRNTAERYSEKEIDMARRAFHAQCTHIDQSVRSLLGAMKEEGLLKNTLIIFMSDHGDMLFDHGMVAKRLFYENSARIPFILSGYPIQEYRGKGIEDKLCSVQDIMPTILDICGIEKPEGMDGISMVSDKRRPYIFGEIGKDQKATRMIRNEHYKLIWYPYGNKLQLFDMDSDRKEVNDLSKDPRYSKVLEEMVGLLLENLHDDDEWLEEGCLKGYNPDKAPLKPDFSFGNQRAAYHWPYPKKRKDVDFQG